jgi:hypothetical protein
MIHDNYGFLVRVVEKLLDKILKHVGICFALETPEIAGHPLE